MMWKKALTGIVALVGSFSMVYAYANISMKMKAASAPVFSLPKGAKVVLGTYGSREVVWDIGNNDNSGSYVLMSSKPIVDKIATYDSSVPVTTTAPSGANRQNYCLKYVYGADGSDNYNLSYCPVDPLKNEIAKIVNNMKEVAIITKPPFLPSISDIRNGGTLGLSVMDRTYKNDVDYWLDGYITVSFAYNSGRYKDYYFHPISLPLNQAGLVTDFVDFDLKDTILYNEKLSNSWSYGHNGDIVISYHALRPYALIDKTKIMFAANTSYTDGNWHNYVVDTANLNENNELNPNKLRIQSSLTTSLQDIQYKTSSIQKITKGSTVNLKISANTGSNTKISVIVYDDTGTNIQYYRMLTSTINGTNDYALDLTGVSIGKYQIAVINEEYDSGSNLPVESSQISELLPLEIVEPLSDLTFTPKTMLQVNSNVNVGDTVGTISSQNGAGTPTYTIIADPAYPSEYMNLSLTGDGKTVVVKGAPLHAGMYHFKIQAQDENGDPNPALEINASFTVNQTNLSVAFDNPNQTKKSITEATTGWNETATATPSTGTKVTYAKSGGSVGLINIDSDTGRITYAGSGGYGKVEIKATADDDPSTGYDDYNSADTTKEIVIYREVDGNVTPHANSSDTTNPTFKTSDASIKPNGVIGTITGTLGTPDNAASGTTTYTYGLKNIDDYNYFSVNPSTGEIKTTADLSTTTGTYHITVTVSDKWSTKEIPVTISVGLAPAENLKFYENSTSNTVINTKIAKVTDTGVTVFATVKGSSNTNPVTYKIQDGSTDVIEVNLNSGAITIKGTGTKVIVAEKAGGSGQADAQTTLTFTVTAGEQNFIYTDSTLSNELPKSGSNYAVYKETYAPSKTFQLYTTGNPTGSTVTYQLKAGSPTDVISVDPSGLVTILNATDTKETRSVIVQATSHDPSGNYNDKTIELPIEIEKGTRVIAFADDPIRVSNGKGSITPNILSDGIIDTDGTAMIEVDVNEDNSIAWTSDGETIQYHWDEVNGKDIKLHVTKPADRNYKEAKAEGTLHILGADESSLTISTPGKIIYGDHFTIRSTQDDSASSNVQYSFTSDNAVFISAPTVSGNKAEFDAIGNSGSTEITITVTRTADGEVPLSKTVKIKVLPKPITIEIEDKSKKRLEENPGLTIKDISDELVSWGGVKDNVDTSVLSLSTTAKKYSPIGSYPITCKNYTTLNDNYPNYIFTLKDGLLNVTDNGNKDFWDIDDDGCPDLNIQIKDEDGNTITINGDANEDGIPDYNIDSNGDGKPDLNIDTDKDGKPDVNLVILKEWKPTKCITLDDIQFSSGISAKAQINIDLDGDLIPDIDIDTKGDFKPHLNISKDGKTPSVNIATIESWKPDQNYNYQGFAYDTINHKPYLNIDTDGDGRPDVNIDLDGDGSADINVDVDGDLIPDVDIDSTGDGKPDINIDTDGDGKADENLMDISQWKPEHNVDQPFEYDTMKIENKNQLEDNGVTVEKSDGGSFLPNMALKVINVTADKKAEVTNKASDLIEKDQEVKQVYEVKLLENGVEVKPDGTLKIRIPIKDGIKNPILLKQKADGTYETINAVMENGYIVYESDELGIVSIIADIDEEQPNPDSEVKGNYYPGNNTGGALTGDTTNRMIYLWTGFASIGLVCLILLKKKQEERN